MINKFILVSAIILFFLFTSSVSASDAKAASLESTKNMERLGMRSFIRCRACHTLEPGGPQIVGPNLNGLIGAPAGTKEGFAFSPALQQFGQIWSRDTLDQWLASPATYIPGNKMAFTGIPDAVEREALINYLTKYTALAPAE